MKIRLALCFFAVAVVGIPAMSGCQFLTQVGSVISGIEAPPDSLWIQQGDTFQALSNGEPVDTQYGKFSIMLRPYPARLKNTVDIYLEAGGQPLDGAAVVIGYDMIGMDHQYAPIIAAAQGRGHYTAALELTMKGLWELKVGVQRPGADASDSYVLRLRNDIDLSGTGGHVH